MELQRARGTFASPTAVQAGDVLGAFDYEGWDTVVFNVGTKINSITEDTFTTSDHGSDLQFFTVADTTTTQSERMRILGNGNVGIGTTNPTFNLDVTGTERVTGAVTFGTSLALGGATLGSNAFAVTGLANFASAGNAPLPSLSVGNATTGLYSVSTTGFGIAVNGVDQLDFGITVANNWSTPRSITAGSLIFNSNVAFSGNVVGTGSSSNLGLYLGATSDTVLTRHAAANFQLGAGDAAAPVAQTLGVQSVVAGMSNTAGVADQTPSTISGSCRC